MKSGAELVKAGLRTFFENASEDLEKLLEMLKLGKFMQSRAQMKSVSQSINYVTVALLPILTALFEHIRNNEFGVDLLCEFMFPDQPFPVFVLLYFYCFSADLITSESTINGCTYY